MTKTLILCDCSKSQSIDPKSFTGIDGIKCSRIHSALCTSEINDAAKWIKDGDAIFACLQEHAVFEELADELEIAPPEFVDIRDRAGWSDEGGKSGPKMAALVSDALLDPAPAKAVDVVSQGMCLILGAPEIALPAALQFSEVLGVTVLLSSSDDAW